MQWCCIGKDQCPDLQSSITWCLILAKLCSDSSMWVLDACSCWTPAVGATAPLVCAVPCCAVLVQVSYWGAWKAMLANLDAVGKHYSPSGIQTAPKKAA
jgi:hypothetical protein